MGAKPRNARAVLRHRLLTSAVQALHLCDGHTKPDAGFVGVDARNARTCRSAHEFRASTGARTRAPIRRPCDGRISESCCKQIADGAPRSRASVAAETGLTRGTVSSLVGELIELDLLRETGEDEHVGRVGRPAQTLELGDRIVAIGLEINVDYLAVCVEDLTGTIRYERRVHTDNRRAQPQPVLEPAGADGGSGARGDRGRAIWWRPVSRLRSRASSSRRRGRCSGRRTSAGRTSAWRMRWRRGCRA